MISITESLFLLTLITCFKKSHGIDMELVSFSEITDLSGKICLESHTVLSQITGSAIKCLQLCAGLDNEECMVASFETSSSTCYGCGTTDTNQMTNANAVSFMRDAPIHYGYLVDGAEPIPDAQLSASSYFVHAVRHSPDRARLGTKKTATGIGGWAPVGSDDTPYIQADFARTRYIVGIATQGRYPDAYPQHCQSYKSSVSLDCVDFRTIQNENSVDVVFPGNTDANTIVTNMLDPPVIAKCIRIHPLPSTTGKTLRFDILGV